MEGFKRGSDMIQFNFIKDILIATKISIKEGKW